MMTCDSCGSKVKGPNDYVDLRVGLALKERTELEELLQSVVNDLQRESTDRVRYLDVDAFGWTLLKDGSLAAAFQFERRIGGKLAATMTAIRLTALRTDYEGTIKHTLSDVKKAFKKLTEEFHRVGYDQIVRQQKEA